MKKSFARSAEDLMQFTLISLEERLRMKIDGVRSSLDAEILSHVDDNASLNKRNSTLENLQNMET